MDKLLVALFISAIIAAAGAFVDVQLLKAEVSKQDSSIADVKKDTQWLKERWIEQFGKE